MKGLGKTVSVNSLRYRGRLYLPHKCHNVCRIIILGDSTTFGFLNNDDHVWSFLLEKELNRLSEGIIRFEVLNLAVGGYRFEQSVRRYLRDFLEYDVDLLLNASVINDFKYNVIYASQRFRGLNQSTTRISRYFSKKRIKHVLMYLWNKSMSHFLLEKASTLAAEYLFYIKRWKNNVPKDSPSTRDPGDYSVPLEKYREYYTKDRMWVRNYQKNFDWLYKQVKEKHHSCKFYLVCWPSLLSDHRFYNDPLIYVLPESLSYKLYNGRSYDSSKPDMIEHHAQYLAHSLLFKQFLIDLSNEYEDCEVVVPYESVCEVSLKERHTIFYDEYHLSDHGCDLFAKEMAKHLWNDIRLK